jgi:hypothetical protein
MRDGSGGEARRAMGNPRTTVEDAHPSPMVRLLAWTLAHLLSTFDSEKRIDIFDICRAGSGIVPS